MNLLPRAKIFWLEVKTKTTRAITRRISPIRRPSAVDHRPRPGASLEGIYRGYETMKDSVRSVGSEPLRIAVLNPLRVVQEATAAFRLAAERKGLGLELAPCSDWHDVVGDRSKVGEILSCLLTNAIQFTSDGRVRLMVKPPDGQYWSIVVEDTGCGMTSEESSRLPRGCPPRSIHH